MGCQGSFNKNKRGIVKYKGMYRDLIALDIDKHHEMIKEYKKQIKILNMEIGIANSNKGSISDEKLKQLIELRKTYHDKIQVQTKILNRIMNNLKISTKGSFTLENKFINQDRECWNERGITNYCTTQNYLGRNSKSLITLGNPSVSQTTKLSAIQPYAAEQLVADENSNAVLSDPELCGWEPTTINILKMPLFQICHSKDKEKISNSPKSRNNMIKTCSSFKISKNGFSKKIIDQTPITCSISRNNFRGNAKMRRDLTKFNKLKPKTSNESKQKYKMISKLLQTQYSELKILNNKKSPEKLHFKAKLINLNPFPNLKSSNIKAKINEQWRLELFQKHRFFRKNSEFLKLKHQEQAKQKQSYYLTGIGRSHSCMDIHENSKKGYCESVISSDQN